MSSLFVMQEGVEDFDLGRVVHSMSEAKRLAQSLKEKTGINYVVVRVEIVWATATLDELTAEDREWEEADPSYALRT